METPPSGSGGFYEPAPAVETAPPREDRAVVSFLRARLGPALGPKAPPALRTAVHRAIREESLTPLARLNSRQRSELLACIEQAAARRPRPAPALIVRLTTVVAAVPAAPDVLGAPTARPAR
jgi:hypothetical protein